MRISQKQNPLFFHMCHEAIGFDVVLMLYLYAVHRLYSLLHLECHLFLISYLNLFSLVSFQRNVAEET